MPAPLPLFLYLTAFLSALPLTASADDETLHAKPAAGESDAASSSAAALLSGEQLYKLHCMACHMENGQGQPGLFPPLADTDWVAAKKPDRLIRIILHGMVGPLKINGQPFFTTAPIMPPQASLSDEQIASILTYIRSAWKGSAAAVSADQVASIRNAEASRATLWTEDELHKIPVQ